jgi:hypothetical protein
MTRAVFIVTAIFVATCFLPNRAVADWISFSGAENAPTIAEIRINKDHVKVELEIFVDDLVAFHFLLPDEFFEGSDIQRPPSAIRMREFSNEGLQILNGDGVKLQAELKMVAQRLRTERPSPYAGKINPYTLQLIPGPPEDKRVLYVELVYPFSEKPASLTFIPPLAEDGRSSVSIGFILYHLDVPTIDFRFLPASCTVMLDWDDPWYSEFEERALKRWQRGSVMSFLYVEPFEVRHEILARVKDLEAWIDLGLRGDEFIEADENDVLKQRVGEFFLEKDKLLIDGNQLKPILDRTAFVKYSMTGSTFLDQPEQLPINSAMLGVIITYLVSEMPKQVEYEWDLWSDRIQKIPTDAIDPAGGLPSYLTPEDNLAGWTNYLKKYQAPTVTSVTLDESLTKWRLPLPSAFCLLALLVIVLQIRKFRKSGRSAAVLVGLALACLVGAGVLYPFAKVPVTRPAVVAPLMSDEEGLAVLNTLLGNVYRSFDFRGEEDVYDKLATSVHGDLLSEIYLQNRKSLEVTQAGGAQARVKEVEILDADIEPVSRRSLGMVCHTQWTAMGTVGHWGHIHTRKNQYDANITVEPVDGAWKITGLEILEEKRIDQYAGQQPPQS